MIRAAFLGGSASTLAAAALPVPVYAPTMRFAVVCPQSGVDESVGRQLAAGVRAAVDYYNEQRAPFDRALLYQVYDDRNTASDAVVQASFATGNPDTWVTIGHVSAASTLAALQSYASAQMPLLVPTVTADRLTSQGYRNVFRLPTKDSDEGGLLAEYAIATGSKAPHVVSQDGPYGDTVADGFVRKAGALHLVANQTRVPAEKPDFDRAAADVLSRAPDSVTFAGNVDDLGPLLAVLRAKGYTGRFLGSQGFFDAQTVREYAKQSEGMIVSSSVPYYPMAPTASRYVSDYQARYGALSPVAAFGYAAVQVLQQAQRRSGATNRLTMTRALATGGPYDTVTGSYIFGPSGDALDPNCYFYVSRNGAFAYERQAHRSGFMLK